MKNFIGTRGSGRGWGHCDLLVGKGGGWERRGRAFGPNVRVLISQLFDKFCVHCKTLITIIIIKIKLERESEGDEISVVKSMARTCTE